MATHLHFDNELYDEANGYRKNVDFYTSRTDCVFRTLRWSECTEKMIQTTHVYLMHTNHVENHQT